MEHTRIHDCFACGKEGVDYANHECVEDGDVMLIGRSNYTHGTRWTAGHVSCPECGTTWRDKLLLCMPVPVAVECICGVYTASYEDVSRLANAVAGLVSHKPPPFIPDFFRRIVHVHILREHRDSADVRTEVDGELAELCKFGSLLEFTTRQAENVVSGSSGTCRRCRESEVYPFRFEWSFLGDVGIMGGRSTAEKAKTNPSKGDGV